MNDLVTNEVLSRKSILKKRKKLKKVKFLPEKVVSKKNFKLLPYTSERFRKKYISNKMAEIKKLPDYDRINAILNSDRVKPFRNPCPIPERKKRVDPFWNTCLYLINQIKQCILTNNWSCLTQCLLTLKDTSKYQPFVLKASIVNFMVNNASVDNHLLEDFLHQCFSCHTEGDMMNLIRRHFVIPNEEEKS